VGEHGIDERIGHARRVQAQLGEQRFLGAHQRQRGLAGGGDQRPQGLAAGRRVQVLDDLGLEATLAQQRRVLREVPQRGCGRS
jgi:hypothetical protein